MNLRSIKDAIFPRTCLCCGGRLMPTERHVCLGCVAGMARPSPHIDPRDSRLARRFWDIFPVESVAVAFQYVPDDMAHSIILRMKYSHPDAELCRYAGQLMALEDVPARILAEGEVLLPVPVTPSRRKKRGFNQSEELCLGISEVTGLPIVTDVFTRREYAVSQASTAHHRKTGNDSGFLLGDIGCLTDRHVVLIDDIITTGATVRACLETLRDIPGIRISVLAFCQTQR